MPAGIRAIELAKANGSWDMLNRSDDLEQPDELIAAFAYNKTARAFYDAMSDSSKRNTLQWLYDAKTDATLQNRIAHVIELCKNGVKPR